MRSGLETKSENERRVGAPKINVDKVVSMCYTNYKEEL